MMTVEAVAGVLYGLMLLTGSVLGLLAWRRQRRVPLQWVKRSRRLLRRSLSGADAFVLVMVVLSMMLLAGSVLYVMGAEDGEMSPRVVIVQSVAMHWMILLAVGLLVRGRRTTLRRVFGIHHGRVKGDFRWGVGAYLVMLPVVLVCSVVYRMILHMLGVELEMQDVFEVLAGDAVPMVRVYLLFLAVFLGPLAEELLFRGVLFPVLARKVGTLASMVLVSGLFASIHMHVPSLVPLFVLSISLCIGYAYMGSIVVPVVMHMLFNAVNLALVFVVQKS